MCMNICGMDSVIVVDSMDEMFISGGVLAEFEHHEPLYGITQRLPYPVGKLTKVLSPLSTSLTVLNCSSFSFVYPKRA